MEEKLDLISDTVVNVDAVKQHCEIVNRNLGNLTCTEKRRGLESLRIQVMALILPREVAGSLAEQGKEDTKLVELPAIF
ncbi:hypothetical protein ACFLTK_05340 [Chloroflexota bacterium]